MGKVIAFPKSRARPPKASGADSAMPQLTTPVEVLEYFLELARQGALLFLAVHAYRFDGLYMCAEIGRVDAEAPPTEVPPEDCA